MKNKAFTFLSRLFAWENESGTTSENVTNNNNNPFVVNGTPFENIATSLQWHVCKNVVSAYNSRNNKQNKGFCVYTIEQVETAKKMLSDFRKNHKQENDMFICGVYVANAKTDTATAVNKTTLAHTAETQKAIKESALKALNYAIKHYNQSQIVTISEIKSAFNDLTDTDIYRYYSVSTMQFNAKSLLAKCVKEAINTKVKADKESTKQAK